MSLNIVLVHLDVPSAKGFLRRLSVICERAFKSIRQLCSRSKTFEEIGLTGAEIIICPRRSYISGRLCMTNHRL